MDKLKEKKLDAFVKDYAATGKSVMGICLGMQLLFDKSYEFGVTDGLGLIRGEVLPLEDALKEKGFDYKVPHMGWNSLNLVKTDNNGLGLKQGDFDVLRSLVLRAKRRIYRGLFRLRRTRYGHCGCGQRNRLSVPSRKKRQCGTENIKSVLRSLKITAKLFLKRFFL